MAADRKKMNEPCDSVDDEKKMVSMAVNNIRDKTFVNEIELITVQDGRSIEEEKKEVNESFLGLDNDCTKVAALNPVDKNKKKSKSLREDSTGCKNESIPLREDCIGHKQESISLRKDSIGHKKMCIPELDNKVW